MCVYKFYKQNPTNKSSNEISYANESHAKKCQLNITKFRVSSLHLITFFLRRQSTKSIVFNSQTIINQGISFSSKKNLLSIMCISNTISWLRLIFTSFLTWKTCIAFVLKLVCRVNQNLNLTETLVSMNVFFSSIQCWNAWIKLGKSAWINFNTRCYLVKKKIISQ